MKNKNKIKGYNYLDFPINEQPKSFQREISKKDVCERINDAIKDENQAIIDYKGMLMQHDDSLSEKAKKQIIEISDDETDHRAKFEIIKKELKCE